jgi:pyruvate,water dikinase
MRDDLSSNSILGRWPLQNLFLWSLSHARALFQLREDTHFYATLAQPLIRRVVLELGHRLKQVDALKEVADIFHLRLGELEELSGSWPPRPEIVIHIENLVQQRKVKRASLANVPMVDPRLLNSKSQGLMNEDTLLIGSPGSPGLASGPVRIVKDVSEFGELMPGEVLVAPATNPAWTPLFQRAAAVVVDTGGSASHAAIVAREYGIPAVMGTFDGTRKLRDGQWIQVDGSRGLVMKAVPNDGEKS